jgi:hypothetical protein
MTLPSTTRRMRPPHESFVLKKNMSSLLFKTRFVCCSADFGEKDRRTHADDCLEGLTCNQEQHSHAYKALGNAMRSFLLVAQVRTEQQVFRPLEPPPFHGKATHTVDIPARSLRKANDAKYGVRRSLHMRRISQHKTGRFVRPMGRGGSSIVPRGNRCQRIHDTCECRGPLVPYCCSPSESCHRCMYCIWPHRTNRPRCNLDIVWLIVDCQHALLLPPFEGLYERRHLMGMIESA